MQGKNTLAYEFILRAPGTVGARDLFLAHDAAIALALENINLPLMAAFLYEDVRALPYRVRHKLMSRFPHPKYFNSGRRALRGGRAQLSEEQIANLIFNLFCRAMRRANFAYSSGSRGHWFAAGDDPMMSDFMTAINNGHGVQGTASIFGTPVLEGECSTVSESLCQVLVAFGFSPRRIGIQSVHVVPSGAEHLVFRATEQLVANRTSIFGVNLDCALNSREMYNARSLAGSERYTADRVDDVGYRYYNARADDALVELAHQATLRNPRSLADMLSKVSERTQQYITNTLSPSEIAGVINTNRSVYDNHYCVFIQPTDRARWQAEFFDPLYALRTTNGIDTLFDVYRRTGAPIALSDDPLAPRGGRVQMYQPDGGSRRRMFQVPEIIAPQLARGFEESRQRLLVMWEAGEVDCESLSLYIPGGLVFDYGAGRGLNMYDFLTARHHDMYLVWDEDDARDTRMPSNGRHWVVNWLAKIMAELMAYEAHVRQAAARGAPAPVVPTPLNRRRSASESFGRPRASAALRRNPFI